MGEVLLAATRDAGSIPRPNTRTPKQVHVAINVESAGRTPGSTEEELHGEAACDPARVPLDMSVAGPAAEVPEAVRCRRRGCASRWPARTT